MRQRIAVNAKAEHGPSLTRTSTGLLQRKCACGASSSSESLYEDGGGERAILRRHTAGGREPASAPPIVHEVLRSPGQSLDSSIRSSMEARFGHDLSHVRVHTGARAAESAAAVNALAYTVGRDLVFGDRMYDPGSHAGRRLLAHELAHSTQQTGGVQRSTGDLSIGSPDHPLEREADRIADRVTRDWNPVDSSSNSNLDPGTRDSGQLRRAPKPEASAGASSSFAAAQASARKIGPFPNGGFEGQFPIQIDVTGIRGDCGSLAWEQFIGGVETIYDDRGNSAKIDACDYIKKNINPASMRFGAVCDDIDAGDARGRRPVNDKKSGYATCTGTAPNIGYSNKDAPGIWVDFNVPIPQRIVAGLNKFTKIEYDLIVAQKLWMTGDPTPFSFQFLLKGSNNRNREDTRKVV